MANPAEHFVELRFAFRNPDRHPVPGRLGATREPGMGTWPLQGTEDGATRGAWSLLRPLFLQLFAAGGATERDHTAAVHRHPARLLSTDSSTERIEQAGDKLAHGLPGFPQSARTLHPGSGVQRGAQIGRAHV